LDSRLWSEPSEILGRPRASVPLRPPRTALGSFEIVGGLQERSVYVYWQQIKKNEQFGFDFNYKITEVLEDGRAR
jgi:hypothetical protein